MRKLSLLVAVMGLTVADAAHALPWSIDMVDADMVKAYERPMAPLPEGVMSQSHLLTPISWRRNWAFVDRWQAEPANPLGASQAALEATDESTLELGARMYNIYCEPCHGDGAELGPVAKKGYPAVAVLSGDDGQMATMGDAWVYLTIRNGSVSGLMPGYGYAMDDDEMWALVAWMRAKMPNAAAVPPAQPDDQEESP